MDPIVQELWDQATSMMEEWKADHEAQIEQYLPVGSFVELANRSQLSSMKLLASGFPLAVVLDGGFTAGIALGIMMERRRVNAQQFDAVFSAESARQIEADSESVGNTETEAEDVEGLA